MHIYLFKPLFEKAILFQQNTYLFYVIYIVLSPQVKLKTFAFNLKYHNIKAVAAYKKFTIKDYGDKIQPWSTPSLPTQNTDAWYFPLSNDGINKNNLRRPSPAVKLC